MANAAERIALKDGAKGSTSDNFSNFSAPNGGAISIKGESTFTVDDSVFTGNSATGTDEKVYGGAIWSDVSTLTVNNATFTGNSSTKLGGAIGLSAGGTAYLNNVTFEENTAINGGALYVGAYVTANVNGADFNTASDTIYVSSTTSKLYLVGEINTCASIDGVVYSYATLNNATLTFNNSEKINVVDLKAATGSANSLIFNNRESKATVAFNSGKADLSAFTLGGIDNTVDFGDYDMMASGIAKIDNKYTVYDDNKAFCGFFLYNKNLFYTNNDIAIISLAGTDGSKGNEFKSLNDMYAKLANYAGDITTEVNVNVAKSVRGASASAANVSIELGDFTVGGDLIGAYGAGNMAFDKLATATTGTGATVKGQVIAGAYTKADTITVAEAELDIDATYKDNVFGASFVYGAGKATTALNTVDVAGEFAEGKKLVAGGMANQGTATVGDTTIDLDGLSASQVYGGGWAQNGGKVTTNGDIEINIGDDCIIDNLFAGGLNDSGAGSAAKVTGDVTINFNGNSEVTNIFLNGKYGSSAVNGNVTLNMNFAGANVEWIDGLTANGQGGKTNTKLVANESFSAFEILHIDEWEINDGVTIDFTGKLRLWQQQVTNGITEYAGQTKFSIGNSYDGDWDVFTAAEGISSFSSAFLDVNLYGEQAVYNGTNAFETSSYALTLSDDKKRITLAAIA